MLRTRVRRLLSVPVALATVAAYAGLSATAPTARAADTATGALIGLFDELDGFLPGVGTGGALGQPLPTTDLVAAGPDGLGLDTLLTSARASLLGGATFGGAATVAELEEAIDDADGALGGGRSMTWDAVRGAASGVESLTVTFTATRTVSSTALDLTDDDGSPELAIGSDGGVSVELALTGTLILNAHTTTGEAWITRTDATPSLAVSASGTIPTPSAVEAGLGILGARLGDGTSYAYSAGIGTSWQDPDNDGRLYFDEPGGTTDDGELSAPGAPTGLVSATVTEGALDATLVLEAVESDTVDLSGFAVTVDVDADFVAGTGPDLSVTAGDLAQVADFLTLSPRDLAQGLTQAAAAVLNLQQATGTELPFLRGSVADAVGAVDAIAAFLERTVPEPTAESAAPGLPDFVSLQDFLETLEAAGVTTGPAPDPDGALPGGARFDVEADYDPALHEVALTLSVGRDAPAAAEPLNPQQPGLTGTADFTDTTLVDTDVDFSALPGGVAALVGRQVTVGGARAVIEGPGDNEHELDLSEAPFGDTVPVSLWAGGTPDDDQAYSIASGDPKTGLVELGDTLQASGGIAAANAEVAVATVLPSYDLVLPLVLDLQPGSEADCNGTAPGVGCPATVEDGAGGSRIVSSTPEAADRIQIRTGTGTDPVELLTASAEISTAVDVRATVGFVGVEVGGTLAVCPPTDAEDCSGTPTGAPLFALRLVPQTGPGVDAQGDIPLPLLVRRLTAAQEDDPDTVPLSSVLEYDLSGELGASLTVSVPGAASFFAGNPSAGVTVTVPDIADLGDVDVVASDLPQLKSLDVDPDNPLALFGGVLGTLRALQSAISTIPAGSAGLDTDIPLVGRSVNDLLADGPSGPGEYAAPADPPGPQGPPDETHVTDPDATFTDAHIGRRLTVGSTTVAVVGRSGDHTLVVKPALAPLPPAGTPYQLDGELQGLINLLDAAPSASLQDLLTLASQKLGAGSVATFEVEDGATDVLQLTFDWQRGFRVQEPLTLDFSLGGDRSLVGAQGDGLLTVDVEGRVKAVLNLPLSAAAVADPLGSLTVDADESLLQASIDVTAEDLRYAANLGPFEVGIGVPETPDPDDAPVDPGTIVRAGLTAALDSSATGDVPLATFLGGLTPTLTGGDVECDGAPAVGGDDLALCAVLPVYLNGDPVNPDPALNAFRVRLPLESSLVDTLDPAGNLGDGTTPKILLPDGLGDAFANAALDLFSFENGFLEYLRFLEQAMGTASFDGKLPLIGKDLQAGSEFIAGLRSDIETAFDGSVPTGANAGALRTFFRQTVEPALPTTGFSVGLTCSATMAAPDAPTPTKGGTGTGTGYVYRVVAVTEVDDEEVDGSISPSSASTDHAATLSDTDRIDLDWDDVTGATAYKVLVEDGGGFRLLAEVEDSEYAHTGATPTGDVFPDTVAGVCPDSTPAEEIQGFTVSLDLGQGMPDPIVGCRALQASDGHLFSNSAEADRACLGAELPLDLGVPGLSLKATDATNPVEGQLGWRLHLTIEVSRDKGFVVRTQDSGRPELSLGASLDVGTLEAQLAFLQIEETNNDTTTPEFAGMFSVDLRAAGDAACLTTCTADDAPFLELTDLLSGDLGDHVVAGLQATVDIDWHLDAGIDPSIPGIEADFVFAWSWGTSTGPASTSDTGGLTALGFRNVAIDPGTFLGETIGKIVKQVVDVLKPVQPILDTIFAPIPVISDLSTAVGGDEVTIATLAEAFSTIAGGPKLGPFLEVVKQIRDLLKALSAECPDNPGTACIRVGDFDLDPGKAVTTDANPATAKSLILPSSVAIEPGGGKSLKTRLDETTDGDISDTSGGAENPGFAFPVLDDPTLLFGLLVGQDVELATFDSGPLTLGFQFQQSYGPVYAPPPVNVVISGGASVSLRVAAGFDTYGIRTAVESGKVTIGILDSLYFKTVDAAGRPIPVVEFSGFLAAGASVSAVVIEVGIIGGIKLTVGFFWNDPNNDGKFRFGEFLTAAMQNPICLFNVGGELSLFIKVFITLGISPFSVSFDFTLVEITLLEFNLKPNCEPPPPRLGGTSGSTLYLFAGQIGDAGDERGDEFWRNGGGAEETWIVRQVPAVLDDDDVVVEKAKVVVQALGISEEFDDDGGAISSVVLDADGYTGKLKVLFQGGAQGQSFTKDAYVRTGSGNDVIRTGEGNSWVDSGAGDDQVTTLDRTDLRVAVADAKKAVVAGGAGADSLTVGNGDDVVLGDGALTFTTEGGLSVTPVSGGDASVALSGAVVKPGSVTWTAATAVAPEGADQIAAGLGGAEIWGHGGDDKIGTANDNPQAELAGIKGTADESNYRALSNTIVGGRGSDRIKSGSAGDEIYTGDKVVIDGGGTGSGDDVDPAGSDDEAGVDSNTVDTGTGSDTVYGSNAKDYITTHSLAAHTATVYGGDEDDVITGGQGTDELFGGPGDDYLVAQEAAVSGDFPVQDALGSARSVTVTGGPVTVSKTLVGGGGSDRIYGASGPSSIFGDGQADSCDVQTDPVSAEYVEHPVTAGDASGRDAADLILGGAGSDVVEAGGGDDHVHTFGGPDRACGSAGKDRIYGGGDADLLFGGSGADSLYGEAADDQLYGGLGDDDAYGDTGDDRLQGNGGSDVLTGGVGDDLVIGGTSKADADDDADRIAGDSGLDVLVGDNADADTIAAKPYPTDLAGTPADKGGPDDVRGGDGDDVAYGGLEDDTVLGGGGDDVLEGNSATDTVLGEAGDDDIVGGSSQASAPGTGHPDARDVLAGGLGEDVISGDNAMIVKVGSGHPLTQGRGLASQRSITLLDQGDGPAAGLSGGDTITGGMGVDVLLGQRGDDDLLGEGGDDYAEGGQDRDEVLGGVGSDDLVGGSYDVVSGSGQTATGQLDAGDTVLGEDGDDVVAGDNAQVLRTGTASPLTGNRGMTGRRITLLDQTHTATAVPDTDPALLHRSGQDVLQGGDAADVLLGQRHHDVVSGDAGDDYAEGGQDADEVFGGDGQDDLVGGSYDVHLGVGQARVGQLDAGDVIEGGDGGDVVLGDNGTAHREGTTSLLTQGRSIAERVLAPYDLVGSGFRTSTHGADLVRGQDGADVVLAQAGTDRVFGGNVADYLEGGQDADWVEGGPGADDLVGGSSSVDGIAAGAAATGQDDAGDVLAGQTGDDLVVGDNALVTRVAPFDPLTSRLGPAGAYVEERSLQLLDLSTGGSVLTLPTLAGGLRPRHGGDFLAGHGGVDVLLGQDGQDAISGGSDGDYAEGHGDVDDVWGDDTLSEVGVSLPVVAWPGAESLGWDADADADGQDDLIGGKSQQGFRDAGDRIRGNGGSDYVTGDNGTMVRRVVDTGGVLTDQVYALRYASPAPPGAAVTRFAPAPLTSTRWCTTRPARTCEPAGASGGDQIWGDDGDDFLYGQDGNDQVRAGAGDDDVYGELGDDRLWGEDGDDAVLGDRGGVRDVRESGTTSRTSTVQAPPAETYVSRRADSVSRVTDLLHDVNGDVFVGAGAGARMVYDGVAFGGNDRIRGGNGADDLHGGTGDDLVNGDSGGDALFGAGGADVLWGGKGCDAALDASSPDCQAGGVFDPTARGTNDRMVDHVFAGKGATSGPSVADGGTGADVVDWRPRGAHAAGAGCTSNAWPVDLAGGTTTLDPCSWFEMTGRDDADPANDQHHQGTDWVYGGWDRDVMQADVAANGPNPGDRLLDWTGAYNLYSHCNAAYGGFNDVREFSPSMQKFLQEWAFGSGAGQVLTDATTKGTSSFEELALVYSSDIKTNGAGKAYPSTPGHFDDPNACQA